MKQQIKQIKKEQFFEKYFKDLAQCAFMCGYGSGETPRKHVDTCPFLKYVNKSFKQLLEEEG